MRQNDTFVDTSKLIQGEEVSYKELCDLIGQPQRAGGDSRTAHISNIQRFVYLDQGIKNKRKYRIIEIYDEPLSPQKQERMQQEQRKYDNAIMGVLMYLLYDENLPPDEKYYKINITRNKLNEALGFANSLYFLEKKYKTGLFSEDTDYFYTKFQNMTVTAFYSIVDRALIYLKKNKNIIYTTKLVVIEKSGEHRFSTEEEENRIVEMEHKLLRKYGCKNEWEVYHKKGVGEKYLRELQDFTMNEMGIYGHYETFEIRVIRSALETDLQEMFPKIFYGQIGKDLYKELEEQSKIYLNQTIADRFYGSNRHTTQQYLTKGMDEDKARWMERAMVKEYSFETPEDFYNGFDDEKRREYFGSFYQDKMDALVKKYIEIKEYIQKNTYLY